MSVLRIDTLTDGTVCYDQRVELDTVQYLLAFRFNTRRERWSFSITGLDGSPILTGQTVSLNVPLNRRAFGGPPGDFRAISVNDDDTPPGLRELGERLLLVYTEAADLAG